MRTAGFFQSDRFPPRVAVGYTLRPQASPGVLQPNDQLIGVAGSAAGGAYATAADLLAFDNSLREGRLLNPTMTARVLEARVDAVQGRRAAGDMRLVGGAPGLNAVLASDGTWRVVAVSNLDPPTAEQAGLAIAGRFRR
jgi:CubicO group peptidase (beta-lactamase class C family)